MKEIRRAQNIQIVLASLGVAALAGLTGLVVPTAIADILTGFTGWSTCALLFIGLLLYAFFVHERYLYRLFTISSVTILFVGYFLYNVFNLEAYRFASSALIFDVGTALFAINVIVRSWSKVKEWLRKTNLKRK